MRTESTRAARLARTRPEQPQQQQQQATGEAHEQRECGSAAAPRAVVLCFPGPSLGLVGSLTQVKFA